MKIILMGTEFVAASYKGWHILTADAASASTARARAGAQDDGTPPSVTPLTPWIRLDDDYARTPQALNEFRQHLVQFIETNRTTIGARKLVIDLNGRHRPLPSDYVKSVSDVFGAHALDEPIEVVVFTSLGH